MKWKYLTTKPIDSNAVSLIKYEIAHRPCPYCDCSYIKSHGYTYGYGDSSLLLTVRRIRFFCSDRGTNKGCSKTFSVLLADRLKNSPTSLPSIYKFLESLSYGQSVYHAFNCSPPCFSITSAYRYLRRWRTSVPYIRSLLCMDYSPPKETLPSKFKTLQHLKLWCFRLFKGMNSSYCQATQFQLRFQRSFLL